MTIIGTVINVHHHGATVRLVDGTLAAVPASEFAAHRATYVAGYDRRAPIELVIERRGRHPIALLPQSVTSNQPASPAAPRLVDATFERRIGEYLKATQEWAPADRPEPAERHFIRKKRRAAFFEARNKPT